MGFILKNGYWVRVSEDCGFLISFKAAIINFIENWSELVGATILITLIQWVTAMLYISLNEFVIVSSVMVYFFSF
jgi:hypothetical protein